MKLSVLKSSYNVGRHTNNKLTKEDSNKCTILLGFIGMKNVVNGSMSEYLGGEG